MEPNIQSKIDFLKTKNSKNCPYTLIDLKEDDIGKSVYVKVHLKKKGAMEQFNSVNGAFTITNLTTNQTGAIQLEYAHSGQKIRKSLLKGQSEELRVGQTWKIINHNMIPIPVSIELQM